jgi:membrane protease YdiL (CAAX protease family)
MNDANTGAKVAERPILDTALFAVIAFLITWGTGMRVVLSTHANLVNGARQLPNPALLPLPIAITLMMIGAFGPFLAAIAITRLRAGCAGVRRLFSQIRRWRVQPVWFLTAFLGFIALCVTASLGGAAPAHWFIVPRPILFAGWSVGPWGEELGWRGYAQPTLQKRLGALGASVGGGAMWSLWRYWPVATPAGGSPMELMQPSFATWLTYSIANSVMMAWLYNSAGGSLPIAWAAHVGLSLGQNLVDKHPIPFGSFVLTFCAAAVIVVLVNGTRKPSRTKAPGGR